MRIEEDGPGCPVCVERIHNAVGFGRLVRRKKCWRPSDRLDVESRPVIEVGTNVLSKEIRHPVLQIRLDRRIVRVAAAQLNIHRVLLQEHHRRLRHAHRQQRVAQACGQFQAERNALTPAPPHSDVPAQGPALRTRRAPSTALRKGDAKGALPLTRGFALSES